MVTLRTVGTDEDIEQWRQVKLTLLPGERVPSVAEIRSMNRPDRLMILAEIDGVVAGHGIAARSDLAGRASIAPRVLPGFRRRGVGTALLRALVDHVGGLGYPAVAALVDEPESAGFAVRFGFVEVDRQVEQVRAVGVEPAPLPHPGFEIVSIADRPELWPQAYHQVAVEAVQDMAVTSPMQVSLDEWERDWINAPEATFVAVVDGAVIGLASLMLDEDAPDRAEQGFTACLRSWRGRGVASTLKRQTLWWAAEHGIREIYTWTQRGNDDMRRLNEHLGFTYGQVSVTFQSSLPLSV
ncbi:GNAT superfamily N-acetyltransferase [Allocatelliglobosispora scoriae]|uniref:GNAT superfamily N-acetyltransferase n=1 Tax=Allocatelliglobosispora scoriae TaxID=643052 RepID=A0A841BSW6_9ACTN|nr:GNAT family N-acetyltransferase [Allocatelliglobosispora scoriae]MBB5869880.1 GNAT superfamily N-acetyltransferase [Allocatelliglobosispora scoriae]